MRAFTVKSALGRSELRNWSECNIIFVCAVSEVIRNVKTCICCAHCPQWRLFRSKKQRMTSLCQWKTRMAQITSKLRLKAGSQCAGHIGCRPLSDKVLCHFAPVALLRPRRRARDSTE